MFNIPADQLLMYALAFLRVGGIVFALPLYGDTTVPVRVRLLLSVALTALILPLLPPTWGLVIANDVVSLAVMVVRELLIGIMIGFVAKLIFDGMVAAASIVGFQMGFGTASLFVPDAGMNMDGFTALHRLIVILVFFSLNFHHMYLTAIVQTFQMIPAGGAVLKGDLAPMFIEMTSQIFVIALQLAAPVLVALMFTMSALGLVARTFPQFNVFVVSFPVSFFIGLAIYVALLPMFPNWARGFFEPNYEQLLVTMRGLGVH